MLDIKLFDYHLPEGRIAFYPAEPRDSSKLLFLPKHAGESVHGKFSDIVDFLRPGDLLVLNDSKVFPARLFGVKVGTGAKVEIFLLEKMTANRWDALVRPGKRLPPGTEIELFDGKLRAVIGERTDFGGRTVDFNANGNLMELIWNHGEIPLPPYINRQADDADKTRYQTVYAENVGAVAAPTAGFHFTDDLLKRISEKSVEIAKITLHPGLGTFRPITSGDIKSHKMHTEKYTIPESTAHAINKAKKQKRRVIAVGTTTVRALESAVNADSEVQPHDWTGTDLFIKPAFEFKIVDGLITNFHLPKSTLLVLISAFATRERILSAYQEAIDRGYRFYSYGDAMLIL